MNEQRPEDTVVKYVTCPFCGEHDFDLHGLAMHLLRGWCPEFDRARDSV